MGRANVMRYLFLSIAVLFLGCAAQTSLVPEVTHPPMPGKDVRPVITSQVPVHCPGIETALLGRAGAESKDGSRVFYVFYRTLPVKPYITVDIAISEFDSTTFDFLQAWVDVDGDMIADEYFDTFEKLKEKYPNMCAIIK